MEHQAFRIIIRGNGADDIAALLRGRLAQVGGDALQVECNTAASESADTYIYTSGTHDTPSFAAEKILDALAERGFIDLEAGALSAEEEEQIRARLQGLGYVD